MMIRIVTDRCGGLWAQAAVYGSRQPKHEFVDLLGDNHIQFSDVRRPVLYPVEAICQTSVKHLKPGN